MCVLYGSVQLHPLCCINHTAISYTVINLKSKSLVVLFTANSTMPVMYHPEYLYKDWIYVKYTRDVT